MIPQTFIDELIARADIVEVIGSRVQLRKSGREFKACCPFHNEKTASFWVSPEKQFYHCFGCGAHGTVLRFLMEHDHLPFPEAVEELASRLGLEVPEDRAAGAVAPRHIDAPLYEMMSRVARFYADALQADERARAYLTGRGLDAETIEQFGIGYAPNAWNELLRRFGTAEDSRRALSELGLIVERDRGQVRDGERHYDRFRDRIMFPIRDGRGRIIAFGGRILDQGEPKYLNSPETALFHKGRELYALYETRRSSSHLERLLIVEGYMDAVRLHQHGVRYAVATLGTATTAEHLLRIFRMVGEVVFAFDGDRAGRAAAWRALQHALPQIRAGREIRFLFLPDGHDPDSLIGLEGRAAFEKRLESTVPLSQYLMRELTAEVHLTESGGRARFARNAGALMAKIPDGVYRDLLVEQIARVVGVGRERLEQTWRTGDSTPTSAAAAPALHAMPARLRNAAGRGSLVRQAISRLLMFPAIAAQVSEAQRRGLDASAEAGVGLLRELLDELRLQPAQNAAQVIQRWSGKPGAESLEKLLQREQLVADAGIAAAELRAALAKLIDLVSTRRLQALEAKDSATGLDSEEKQEYLRLMVLRGPRDARGG